MIANDGDGDAFDVRVFGHNCIIRAYAWEKLSNSRWKIGERTMVPRISNEDGDDVKIAIWPNDSAHGAHTEGSTTILKTPENHRNQPSESP